MESPNDSTKSVVIALRLLNGSNPNDIWGSKPKDHKSSCLIYLHILELSPTNKPCSSNNEFVEIYSDPVLLLLEAGAASMASSFAIAVVCRRHKNFKNVQSISIFSSSYGFGNRSLRKTQFLSLSQNTYIIMSLQSYLHCKSSTWSSDQ